MFILFFYLLILILIQWITFGEGYCLLVICYCYRGKTKSTNLSLVRVGLEFDKKLQAATISQQKNGRKICVFFLIYPPIIFAYIF